MSATPKIYIHFASRAGFVICVQLWKIAKALFTLTIEFFETAAEVNIKNKVSRNYLYCTIVYNQTLIVVFNTFVKIYEGI